MSSRALVAAVVLVALPACSGDGNTPQAVDTGTPSASTGATAGSSGTPSGSASASASAPASASGSPSASAGPTATGPGSTAPPTSPPPEPSGALPRFGRYPVRIDGFERFGPKGGEQSTRQFDRASYAEIRSGTRKDQRRFFIRYSAERDDTLTLSFAGGAVRLEQGDSRVAVGSLEQRTVLAPEPPCVVYPADARVGQRFSGRFSGPSTGTYSGRVLRRERLVVGGTGISTLVVEWTMTFSGQYSGTTKTTTWWDPARRAALKQRTVSDVGDALTSYHQESTVTLQRLTPQG